MSLLRKSSKILVLILLFACSTATDHQYIEKGKLIADDSFKILSGHVKSAIQEGGVGHAIQYCNLKANPLIDSLSKRNNVSIRRISFNARNPLNRPQNHEKEVLIGFANAHKEGRKSDPLVVIAQDGSHIYYQPIYISAPLCLTCHGNPGITIAQADYDLILSLYPADAAIGYQEGDLRGMWSITFSE